MPAISVAEGFNLGYCKAKPGKGPLMHNHDTNETFIAMTGRWRAEWNEGDAIEYVDLDPYDVISFPVGVARRFMNVTYDEPQQRAPADVHHRRRPAAGGVHCRRDAALRSVRHRTSTTNSVASASAAPAIDFHSADGCSCA